MRTAAIALAGVGLVVIVARLWWRRVQWQAPQSITIDAKRRAAFFEEERH